MLFEIEDTRKSNTTLFNVDEGFIKGNMFTNLYDKYKHYEPKKLLPTTEKDLLLYNIYKLSFAINDLNLYLDINPNDTNMYETFKKIISEYKMYVKKYEDTYGPLTICEGTYNKYSWLNVKMPWEDNYV